MFPHMRANSGYVTKYSVDESHKKRMKKLFLTAIVTS